MGDSNCRRGKLVVKQTIFLAQKIICVNCNWWMQLYMHDAIPCDKLNIMKSNQTWPDDDTKSSFDQGPGVSAH